MLCALRGLREREQSGAGCHFDISQVEAAVALVGEQIAEASLDRKGALVEEDGPARTVDGVFRCRDRDEWVAVTASDTELGADDGDGLFLTAASGSDLYDLPGLVQRVSASRSKEDAARSLRDLDFAAFPVMSTADLIPDPHLAARQFFTKAEIDGLTGVLPGSPIHSPGVALTRYSRHAPAAGEHTLEILREDLRLGEAEIEWLLASGAVEQL